MPVAKIHVNEGVYTESRIKKISNAVQGALLEVLKIPLMIFSRSFTSFRRPVFFTPHRF
jgi:hypothetical protein